MKHKMSDRKYRKIRMEKDKEKDDFTKRILEVNKEYKELIISIHVLDYCFALHTVLCDLKEKNINCEIEIHETSKHDANLISSLDFYKQAKSYGPTKISSLVIGIPDWLYEKYIYIYQERSLLEH